MEGESNFDSIYDGGVIGTIIRKIVLPDGRVKILFQGLARGHIVERLSDEPMLAVVDTIKTNKKHFLKVRENLPRSCRTFGEWFIGAKPMPIGQWNSLVKDVTN